MNLLFSNSKPIVACSSGLESRSAISIIRVSGFSDLVKLNDFFDIDCSGLKPRYSHLAHVKDGEEVLDQVLLTYFPAPNSYTGENVIELSVHGNPFNIKRILSLFLRGEFCREAAPGEFTYRALKNKKLSLSQVEGLDSLLNANSEVVFSQGLSLLRGELHEQYLRLYNLFIKLRASIELFIDFSDDVGEENAQNNFESNLDLFFKQISFLNERTKVNLSSLLSPTIILVGKTNAGKSSLFNFILNSQRSIISDRPGTTRDYISEFIEIAGVNYKLIDTAGLRDSQDQIEVQGMDLALNLLDKAFCKILVVNPFLGPLSTQNFKDIDFIIFTHSDCGGFKEKLEAFRADLLEDVPCICLGLVKDGSIGPGFILFGSGSIGPEKINIGPIEPAKNISSLNTSLNSLTEYVREKYQALSSKNPIVVERHTRVIEKAFFRTESFVSSYKSISDVAVMASEINLIGEDISELIGVVNPDTVLKDIFMNFCIGK